MKKFPSARDVNEEGKSTLLPYRDSAPLHSVNVAPAGEEAG
jgi:hypothetical protein